MSVNGAVSRETLTETSIAHKCRKIVDRSASIVQSRFVHPTRSPIRARCDKTKYITLRGTLIVRLSFIRIIRRSFSRIAREVANDAVTRLYGLPRSNERQIINSALRVNLTVNKVSSRDIYEPQWRDMDSRSGDEQIGWAEAGSTDRFIA